MMNPQKAIIVKDDGHIDPKIWFGRYGIKFKSSQILSQNCGEDKQESTPDTEQKKPLLRIRTSTEGVRRWRLGIRQSKKQGTKGWHTLELRLHIMKHGTADGFQFKNFNDYKKIVEFYS